MGEEQSVEQETRKKGGRALEKRSSICEKTERRGNTANTTQLLTTSNSIGPWYHTALLFSGLGSIVLLFVLLFSQQIREDLVRAAYHPQY